MLHLSESGIAANESWGYSITPWPTRKLATKSTSSEGNGVLPPSHALPGSRLRTRSMFSATQLDTAGTSLPTLAALPLNRTKHHLHESIGGDGYLCHASARQFSSPSWETRLHLLEQTECPGSSKPSSVSPSRGHAIPVAKTRLPKIISTHRIIKVGKDLYCHQAQSQPITTILLNPNS